MHWRDWYWSWNSNTLATWCGEPTHWKTPWYWERLKAGRRRDDRGWDGWMASLTQWTWVWVNSGSWWWKGGPGVLQFMQFQRVGHDWTTELNWMLTASIVYNIYDISLNKLWSLWWTGKPGVLQSIGLQSWTWLSNWTELKDDGLSRDETLNSDLGQRVRQVF